MAGAGVAAERRENIKKLKASEFVRGSGKVLRGQLSQHSDRKQVQQLRKEVVNKLVKRSGGVFLSDWSGW
jgi:hypothetical protein